MISNKGIAEPVLKGRHPEFAAFADALRSIAAEECHTVVAEFLELVGTVTAKSENPDRTLADYIKNDDNAPALEAFNTRYAAAAEDEQPGELLKDYLKERNKVV
jgi:hypothetical protein